MCEIFVVGGGGGGGGTGDAGGGGAVVVSHMQLVKHYHRELILSQ